MSEGSIVECNLLKTTRIYEIMSSPPVTIFKGESIEAAAKKMYASGVGSVLVVDEDERLAGIITRRDLIYLLASGIARRNPPVERYMVESVITAREDETADDALQRMREAGVRHLAVIDNNGRPVGVVSMFDILMLLARVCIEQG